MESSSPPASTTTSRTSRKRVWFRDEPNVCPSVPPSPLSFHGPLHDDEPTPPSFSSTWWSRSELSDFKTTARMISKELRTRGYNTACLEEAHEEAGAVARSCSCCLDNNGDGYVEVSSGLVRWCTHFHTRRGLERWSSRRHGLARKSDDTNARSGVLAAQEGLRRLASKTGNLTEEVAAEALALRSRELTLRSRLFARMVGRADEEAARAEHCGPVGYVCRSYELETKGGYVVQCSRAHCERRLQQRCGHSPRCA